MTDKHFVKINRSNNLAFILTEYTVSGLPENDVKGGSTEYTIGDKNVKNYVQDGGSSTGEDGGNGSNTNTKTDTASKNDPDSDPASSFSNAHMVYGKRK